MFKRSIKNAVKLLGMFTLCIGILTNDVNLCYAENKYKASNYKLAYAKVISDTVYNVTEPLKCSLEYINNDNIPELCIYNYEDDYCVHVYTYKNGAAFLSGDVSTSFGPLTYLKKKGIILLESRGVQFPLVINNKGKLVNKDMTDSISQKVNSMKQTDLLPDSSAKSLVNNKLKLGKGVKVYEFRGETIDCITNSSGVFKISCSDAYLDYYNFMICKRDMFMNNSLDVTNSKSYNAPGLGYVQMEDYEWKISNKCKYYISDTDYCVALDSVSGKKSATFSKIEKLCKDARENAKRNVWDKPYGCLYVYVKDDKVIRVTRSKI